MYDLEKVYERVAFIVTRKAALKNERLRETSTSCQLDNWMTKKSHLQLLTETTQTIDDVERS